MENRTTILFNRINVMTFYLNFTKKKLYVCEGIDWTVCIIYLYWNIYLYPVLYTYTRLKFSCLLKIYLTCYDDLSIYLGMFETIPISLYLNTQNDLVAFNSDYDDDDVGSCQ